jgi:FMN phosphatase YigB (HAD superfamily)
MAASPPVTAFLFDVDNTLLDNDGVIADLQSHLESEAGIDCAQQYWHIFEQLRTELGQAPRWRISLTKGAPRRHG